MPKNKYRVEVALEETLLISLDKFRSKCEDKLGKKPTRADVVRNIIELFFEKQK